MRYQGIKVTLITGFLGAGKTTLIRQLLEKTPLNERWVVLVNEFGDIGIDSAFYSDMGVGIKEVPGGCVCCTTSAAFQQGLNQLIRQYNPDRIFIEPSGLGHPKQIVQQLQSASYQGVLLLSGVFCVLDARNLQDERYTSHEIFNDQIDVADGIVLSHVNKYQKEDIDYLNAYFDSECVTSEFFMSDPMYLDLDLLDINLKDVSDDYVASKGHVQPHNHSSTHKHSHNHAEEKDNPPNSERWHYVKQQDLMKVLGWRWPIDSLFSEERLLAAMKTISMFDGVYRIKGVFLLREDEAAFINVSRSEMTVKKSFWRDSSRLEVIGDVESDWADAIAIDDLERNVIGKR